MKLSLATCAAVLLIGCGSDEASDDGGDAGAPPADDGSTPAAGPDGAAPATDGGPLSPDSGGTALPALPNGGRIVADVVNLVDSAAVDELLGFLELDDASHLTLATKAFYAQFRDEYDFVFFAAPDAAGEVGAYARFELVNRPAIPGIGADHALSSAYYAGPSKLRGVIGTVYGDGGLGPFAHEILHYWGVELDASFGFGKSANYEFGSHWAYAGVRGQLGGFAPESLRCATPAGAVPPACTPEANGNTRYVMDNFGPNTNSYASVPYAPLELYLMGLIPASEVPSPIPVLDDAIFDLDAIDPAAATITIEARGLHQVSMAEIVARHGARAPAPESERAFRAAFTVVTRTPASDDVMQKVGAWQQSFGSVVSGSWPSFATHTGNRATLDTRLGARHGGSEVIWDSGRALTGPCDVLAQNCGLGFGCFSPEEPMCTTSDARGPGESCVYGNDCAGGSACLGGTCVRYCDAGGTNAAMACETRCPGSTEPVDLLTPGVNLAYCTADFGD